MQKEIQVSVIMPCRNEVRHIRECLESVLGLIAPDGGFEVIVADGMSDDGTRDILESIAAHDARVRIVDNPHRTTPHGLNAAIRHARGEIIVRVDAHSSYAPDYIVQCLKVMHDSGADNVGGPALTRADSWLQQAIAAASHSRFAVGNSSFHQPDYDGPTDTVPYGCYRRDRLLELGLFDEELVRNQDDELNFRLIQSGGKIWQSPSIRSWYSPRSSFGRLFQQYFQYGYWKVRVIQKRGEPASLRHLVPGAFVALMALLILLSITWPAARLGALSLGGAYLAGVFVASVLTATRAGVRLFPALVIAFPCYHFGYGTGFLVGLWDFAVLHRGGRFRALSRA